MKAIIVDDEVWSRKMIRSLGRWEALGIELAGEAENGRDGLALIASVRPDIVLLDMRMPGMEGTELIRRLNERGDEAKVIVVSGHADFQYTKHAIDYKAAAYLLKPIDEDELNAALDKCVRELRLAAALRERELESVHYSDKALQAPLSEAKRELGSYLQGLNEAGALRTLERLADELERLDYSSAAGLRKLYMELYLLLEDFLARSDLEIAEVARLAEAVGTDEGGGYGRREPGDSGGAASRGPDGEGSIRSVVGGLAALYATAIRRTADRRRSKDRLDVGEVRAYIDRHYDRPISLETVADAFYVTKEYLSKAFKAQTGVNLTDYVIRLRMDKARGLVLASELKIKDIASAVGYEDVTYFNRLFKHQFGETPGQMRARP